MELENVMQEVPVVDAEVIEGTVEMTAEEPVDAVPVEEQEGVTFPNIEQPAVEMIVVNGMQVPLHIYLQHLNRHQRRQFMQNYKKDKKSKKIQAFRADNPVVTE